MFIDCVFCASKYNVWMLRVLWRFLLIQGTYTVHPCIIMMVTWKLVRRCMDGPGNWQLTVNCDKVSLRCNGLEFCSRRISCFHAFWCFPRPILAIFHIAMFFYPDSLSFSVQKYYAMKSRSGTSRKFKMRRHAGLDIIIFAVMLNYD